jgi:hypothetical protein
MPSAVESRVAFNNDSAVRELELHRNAGGDVVRRDDEAAHRRVVDEVHDRQLEREVRPVVAQ